jgi:hypothetical protein
MINKTFKKLCFYCGGNVKLFYLIRIWNEWNPPLRYEKVVWDEKFVKKFEWI